MTTHNETYDTLIGLGLIAIWLAGSFVVYVVIKRKCEGILTRPDLQSVIVSLLAGSWGTLMVFAVGYLIGPSADETVVKYIAN